jgi:heme/copper-type cytochrome/quinol oxidase subunit 2
MQSYKLCVAEQSKAQPMSIHASQQLHAIASMMASGQRNLRMERWSLVLWGVAGGLLFLMSESILTPTQLPDLKQRALAWFVLIVVVLCTVGATDWYLTRRAKQARDEMWSFIHRQVLEVLWLLMGIGALLTFAVFFYGGGYMLYTAHQLGSAWSKGPETRINIPWVKGELSPQAGPQLRANISMQFLTNASP